MMQMVKHVGRRGGPARRPPRAITLRNIPPDLAGEFRRLADDRGVSLNRLVVALLAERLGRARFVPEAPVHHDLDKLAGAWSARDAAAFDDALAEQRRIDPDVWEPRS